MFGTTLNLLVGVSLIAWGSLVLQQRPVTRGFMVWIQGCADSFMGGEYCVPFYLVALAFILLGGFALFNAFMIAAETYGFWIV